MKNFFRYPALIVAVIAVITVFFGLQLFRAQLDNNNFRFVPDDDPAMTLSRYIDDTFGSSLFVLVGLERKYAPVFDGPFLNRIRDYVSRVEEIDVVSSVSSLVNTDYITAEGDSIVVKKLVDVDFTGTPEETAELKRRVLSWDLYDRALVSDDFTATQILVSLSIPTEDAGRPEVVDGFLQIRDMAREMFAGFATVYVTGLPVINATVNEAVNADLVLLVPLVVVAVLAMLFFSFRRFTAVALPLLTVVIATIWSIGAMPLAGVKLSIISTVLPVILIAVGSAYGIHVVTHYLSDRGDGELSVEEHRELVFALLRRIGKPVFLAALTTFVGFASFCFTKVLPIREFGYFASFGVVASFAVAVTLIPALLLIRGPKPFRERKFAGRGKAGADALNHAIAGTFTAIARRKGLVLFITGAVSLLSVYGLSRVIIDNVMVEYFREDTDIYRSDLFIREKFGGSKVVSIVVEADSPEILLHPDTLSAMDGLSQALPGRVPEIGKVMGFTDMIKRINQVFNANESPLGLAPSAGGPSLAGEAGFETGDGFGFGFGFDGGGLGDFGFGFEEAAGGPAANSAAAGNGAPEDGLTGRHERVLTEAELFSLLDRAAGEHREMDADDLVRNLERLVNWEGAAYYEIPISPERYGKRSAEELQRLVSNYLVLLAGNISEYANDPLEPTAIKATVQLRTVGQADTNRAVDEINAYIAANFPEGLRTVIGGSALVEGSLNALMIDAQMTSLICSLILVFIIIAASNRSLIAGFIGILPLSISILINFAVMGFAGIKLNLGTVMVASVSVGVGIDYTIHFIETYKREYRVSGGKGEFLRRTFAVSGKAILINAVSVGAGFAVLLLSRFNILAHLGLLVALTMFTSALVSLTVIPVLLTILKPKFVTQEVRT
ncbi:MAG: MMPL family transporter [Spirochaetaceae bacterium]|jgi:predicted RND superfamily exporter protein|nr:MMPL family transporter [Spirochaetaceae bacterium]